MRRLRISGLPGLRLHRFPSLEQPPLGVVQAVVCTALFLLDPQNRGLGFFLACLLRAELLFRGAPFDGDLFPLAIEPIHRLE